MGPEIRIGAGVARPGAGPEAPLPGCGDQRDPRQGDERRRGIAGTSCAVATWPNVSVASRRSGGSGRRGRARPRRATRGAAAPHQAARRAAVTVRSPAGVVEQRDVSCVGTSEARVTRWSAISAAQRAASKSPSSITTGRRAVRAADRRRRGRRRGRAGSSASSLGRRRATAGARRSRRRRRDRRAQQHDAARRHRSTPT